MNVSLEFIKRLQECDKRAFEELYEMYAGQIKTICYRYIKSWQQSEDLLQETFVIIYQKIHQFSGKGSFEGWIKRISVNNCLRVLKQQQKFYFESIDGINISEEEQRNESELDYRNQEEVIKSVLFSQEEIFSFIESLPDGFRIVFSMYVLEGYKHKDISELLGISESTSKTQLLRARLLLQKKMYKVALSKQSEQKNIQYKEVIGKRN